MPWDWQCLHSRLYFLLYGNSTGLAANLLILGSFFDPAQWNVKYFQWSSAGNRTAEDSGDYGSNRTGCGYCGSGSVAVYYKLGVYALLIAMVIYSVVVCVLNDRAMKKYLQYKNPWKEGYLYPVLASVPMGIVAGCICYGLNIFVKSNFICLIVSIPVAAVVYLFAYLIISKPSESQLRRIPGGSYLIRIAEKLPFWQNN